MEQSVPEGFRDALDARFEGITKTFISRCYDAREAYSAALLQADQELHYAETGIYDKLTDSFDATRPYDNTHAILRASVAMVKAQQAYTDANIRAVKQYKNDTEFAGHEAAKAAQKAL